VSAKAVIVVDDERDIVSVIRQHLEKQGYLVHGFTDPAKALAHAKDCKDCGVIVSDIKMPIMNGFQLVEAVKEVRPDMKVVVMTAVQINKKEWQNTLPSTEVDEFLIKPVRMSQLIEAIERCARVVRQS
jgi:DNA-binding NtrC family response regulator